jgi:hypothetical protein
MGRFRDGSIPLLERAVAELPSCIEGVAKLVKKHL